MLPAKPLHCSATARPLLTCLLLCLLMLALLLHGQAAALRQMLGAAHRHVAAEHVGQATGWLQTTLGSALDWRLQLLASSPLIGGHGLAAPADLAQQPAQQPAQQLAQHQHHDHGERHHHASGDASVLALEAGGDSSGISDGSASSLTQPLALGSRPAWAPAAANARHWPPASAPSWQSAAARLPERPPRG